MANLKTGVSRKQSTLAYRKIWRALFSWNSRFDIQPFALLPTNCESNLKLFIGNYKLPSVLNVGTGLIAYVDWSNSSDFIKLILDVMGWKNDALD